uniref:dTDP-4-dehydrorhamnose 3,5-epimerase n=1 Tax=Panagrolaimus sp. PS1159 TaxID=55785 RepID=A0AC35FQC7_9BILA
MSSIPNVIKRVKAEIESIPEIPDLKLIRPKAFPDDRGFFVESYNVEEWKELLNFNETFKQDNHSFSKYGVLRGLHTQPGMGKLVSVVSGKIFDVAVDIRKGSPTFGKWHGVVLDAESKTNFWIPDGFLHGFQCISPEGAHVTYKCSGVYDPKSEFGINPFDSDIAVDWPIKDQSKILVSERDKQHSDLKELNLHVVQQI